MDVDDERVFELSVRVEAVLEISEFNKLVIDTNLPAELVGKMLTADLLSTRADTNYTEIGKELREHFPDTKDLHAATAALQKIFFFTLTALHQEAHNWDAKGLTSAEKALRRAAMTSVNSKVARAKRYAFPPEKPAVGLLSYSHVLMSAVRRRA